jgi:putative ABC transport system ATP-binding protein
MDVIKLDQVTKAYRVGESQIHALDGLSMSIAPGEFTALVGPSGSGKTTLLQMMGCLDRPDSGTVWLQGRDVTRLSANERADLRRDMIGFIFQFFALVPVLTAYENIELPLLLAGASAEDRRSRVPELLKAVGLADRAQHRPDQLSGGEQQRVAIARALATRPALVLADEPTANLDTENGLRLRHPRPAHRRLRPAAGGAARRSNRPGRDVGANRRQRRNVRCITPLGAASTVT